MRKIMVTEFILAMTAIMVFIWGSRVAVLWHCSTEVALIIGGTAMLIFLLVYDSLDFVDEARLALNNLQLVPFMIVFNGLFLISNSVLFTIIIVIAIAGLSYFCFTRAFEMKEYEYIKNNPSMIFSRLIYCRMASYAFHLIIIAVVMGMAIAAKDAAAGVLIAAMAVAAVIWFALLGVDMGETAVAVMPAAAKGGSGQ